MATRFLDKEFGANASTAIANDATGRAKVQNLPNAAGFVYDQVDGGLKYNDAGTIRSLVATTAAGVKIASGTGTLDGTNPTTVATGLTTVTAFVATLIATTVGAAPAALVLTRAAAVGGSVDVYAWAQDGTASTDTDTFSWIAIGA